MLAGNPSSNILLERDCSLDFASAGSIEPECDGEMLALPSVGPRISDGEHLNVEFLAGKLSSNVRIKRHRPRSPSTCRNLAYACDGEKFMDYVLHTSACLWPAALVKKVYWGVLGGWGRASYIYHQHTSAW